MSHVVDLTGKDFGYLHVIGRDTSKKGDRAHWICRCKCGTICSKDGRYLRNGQAAAASGKNARPRSSPRGIQPKSQKPNRRRKNSAAARSGQAPGSVTTHSARRATTTAAPGAAPSAASARNANLPASPGGKYLQFEGRIAWKCGSRRQERNAGIIVSTPHIGRSWARKGIHGMQS